LFGVQKTVCGNCGTAQYGWYDRAIRRARDLSNGDTSVYLEFEVRRVACRTCGQVKRERLAFLADNTHCTERFAYFAGRRCRAATVQDVAKELHLEGSRPRQVRPSCWNSERRPADSR
jgi:transposase